MALSIKGRAAPGLLDSYEVERIPVIAEMLKISTDIFNKTFGQKTDALSRAETLIKESDKQADKDSVWFRGRKLLSGTEAGASSSRAAGEPLNWVEEA